MWDELRVVPAGQGAFDAGKDHGKRVWVLDPDHGLRERFGGGVLGLPLGVGLPERQETLRQIDLGDAPLASGIYLSPWMGVGLGGLGGRGEGRRGVTLRYVTRYVTSDALSLPRPITSLAFCSGRARLGIALCFGDGEDLLGRQAERHKLSDGRRGQAHG